ncbi:MAG: DUF5522 domain-containing protein [Ferruginibacter sp.]
MLTEGTDFYYNEAGLFVFTETYHRQKGFCCGNGCLHCPYNFINVPEPHRENLLKEKHEAEKHGEGTTGRSKKI